MWAAPRRGRAGWGLSKCSVTRCCPDLGGLGGGTTHSTPCSPMTMTSPGLSWGVCVPSAPALGSLAQPGTCLRLSPSKPEQHSLACVSGRTTPPLCRRGPGGEGGNRQAGGGGRVLINKQEHCVASHSQPSQRTWWACDNTALSVPGGPGGGTWEVARSREAASYFDSPKGRGAVFALRQAAKGRPS